MPLSLLQAEQYLLSHSFFVHQMLQSLKSSLQPFTRCSPVSPYLPCLYLGAENWIQHSKCVSLMLRRKERSPPYLLAALQMQPRTLLVLLATRVHCGLELGVYSLTLPSCFPAGWPQCILVHGIVPYHVQDFSFPFVDICKVSASPLSQPVQVPLNGNTTFWCISHSSQFCISCKFAEGALYPIVHVINEDVVPALGVYH